MEKMTPSMRAGSSVISSFAKFLEKSSGKWRRSPINLKTFVNRNAINVFKRMLSNSSRCTDVLIIGGGVMGSSIAYFLKEKSPDLDVTVIERDSTVKRPSQKGSHAFATLPSKRNDHTHEHAHFLPAPPQPMK